MRSLIHDYHALLEPVGAILTAVVLYLIRRLHHTMNSKMDRLLELTARAAKAEGVLEERTRREAQDQAEGKAFRQRAE